MLHGRRHHKPRHGRHHKRDHDNDSDGDHHHHEVSHKGHKTPQIEVIFPCKCEPRCKDKQRDKDDVTWLDGKKRTIFWQRCSKDDARKYIEEWRVPPQHGEDEVDEQLLEPEQEDQQQEPQDEEAGPSSIQDHPTTGVQPVEQQEAGPSGGGNTIPGPFGRPVPALSGEPPLAEQQTYTHDTGYPGGTGYSHGMGYYHGTGFPQGAGYSQGMGYYQHTEYPQSTPVPGDYGGDAYMPYLGGYGNMPTGHVYEEGQDMPYQEEYGGDDGMSFAGGPAHSEGGARPESTVGALVPAPRPRWVENRPENFYDAEETDGVAKYSHVTVSTSNYDHVNYSNVRRVN